MLYCNHIIETLTTDMKTIFTNLFEMEISDWMYDPSMDMKHVDVVYQNQNELIGFQNVAN